MIGIFDSGLGGLTVLKEIKKQLPKYSTLYLGDLAHLPYGTKSAISVTQFSKEITKFLINKNVDVIVVACNTASATALETLKKENKIPIIGVIDGAVKEAIKKTKNKKIGVIATTATCKSHAYQKAVSKFDLKTQVYEFATPLFVPLVEEGFAGRSETRRIARYYLRDLKNKNIDTLILGCTHYPIIHNLISDVMGKKIKIIDPAFGVVESLKEIIKKIKITSDKKIEHKIYLTDLSPNFEKVSERFLEEKILNQEVISLS